MKKRIGIVTIHTTYNYGAVLQAYATEAFFNENGFDAELIDYTNDHIQEQLKLFYKQYGKLRGYLISFIRNTIFGRLYYYKKGFGSIHKTCKFSKESYQTHRSLENVEYDILIAGSDQLWNPIITGELDPVFFLQFGKAEKRISFASSLGSYKLTDGEKDLVKEYLARFDAISVREGFAKEQLQPIASKEIKVVLDPTLLLSKDYWVKKLAVKSKFYNTDEKYIVTYFAGGNKNKYREAIRNYAGLFNLPVWTIQYSNYSWRESSRKILGATMEDFVALISNAELVITDSFHGVAFSLNLEKEFIPLANTANPVRVLDLLKKLNIDERIDMPIEKYKKIDYSIVTPLLEEMRADSSEWVMNEIDG